MIIEKLKENKFIRNYTNNVLSPLLLFLTITFFFLSFYFHEKQSYKLYIFFLFLTIISFFLGLYFYLKEISLIKESFIKDSITKTLNKENLFDVAKNKEGIILILDIVRFKKINELFGFEIGNYILYKISQRVKKIFSDYYFWISRIWGNTFVLFFPSNKNDKGKLQLLKNVYYLMEIKHKLEKPFKDKNLTFYPKFTIAVYQKDKNALNNFEEFIGFLEFLSDHAKIKEKGSVYIYKEKDKIKEHLQEFWQKEVIINDAIKNKNIIAYFQPIIDAKSFKVFAFECLARIKYKDKILPLGNFLEIAIETGTILEIDLYLLNYIEKIRNKLPVKLFINLAPKSLYSKYTLSKILKSNLKDCIIEITEQYLVENLEQIEKLKKALKFEFAVDDFGVGYSSLKTVIDLASKGIINYIKIDGSLIRDISIDNYKQQAVESIVNMAKKINLKTVAEFVENKKTVEILKNIGVDLLQGYYFSPPLPLEEAKKLLERGIF